MRESGNNESKEGGLAFYTDMSRELFSQWRFYRFLSALIGALAIVPEYIDYNQSFDMAGRSRETCSQLEVSQVYRLIAVILSFIAIFLLIPYKIYYYSWLKNIPMTFREYPPFHRVSVLEVMEMQRKRKFLDYLLEENTWVVIVLYLILPYPTDFSTVSIPQQMNQVQYTLCYYTSEILLAFMFFRLVFLVIASFSYGKFQSDLARTSAEKYGVKLNPAFSIKCYIGANAIFILFTCFLVPGILLFGTLMRIFERPNFLRVDGFKTDSYDFDSYESSFWNIIITMSTVGYGDTFPKTILGRTVVVLSIFWGGVILALTFVSVGSVLQLKPNERRAYNAIIVGREAAIAIGDALATSKYDHKNKNAWSSIRSRLRAFLAFKSLDPTNEDFVQHSTKVLNAKINHMENTADKIQDKLEKFARTL
jgi:hypothetical protein